MTATASRAEVSRVIRSRPRVSAWIAVAIAVGFALVLAAIAIPGEHAASDVYEGGVAPFTVRVPPLAGAATRIGRIGGDGAGVVIASGERAKPEVARAAEALAAVAPFEPAHALALFAIAVLAAGGFAFALRRSPRGQLVRVQLVTLGAILVAVAAAKVVLLFTAASVLVIPVAAFAVVPALALDRTVAVAAGVLAAIAIALIAPFDAGCAAIAIAQAAIAGLVAAERPAVRLRATLVAGGAALVATALIYPVAAYLVTGRFPLGELADPARSAWVAALLGPVIATALALACVAPYQWLAGEITRRRLRALGELSQPLLVQIAEKAPGTWQHSLMIASLAEPAARAIGADPQLARAGALYHDAGKSLHAKYFAENLAPGEVSPQTSFDAVSAHVIDGVTVARKHGVHARLVDFMHMHHGLAGLEPRPQTRETALLGICDELEQAFRALKKPDADAVAELVHRVVYGQLHAGRLDESALTARDLRILAESLRETLERALPARAASTPVTATAATAPTAPIENTPATALLQRESTQSAAAFAETAPVPRVDDTSPPRVRPLKVSKDGLPHVELARPSDGPLRAPIERPSVERPEPAANVSLAERDTGRHRAQKLAYDNAQEIAKLTADGRPDTDAEAAEPEDARAAVRRGATASDPELQRAKAPSTPPDTERARKRAATLPPIASIARLPSGSGPTRRAPTEPPPMELRRPSITALPFTARPPLATPVPAPTPPEPDDAAVTSPAMQAFGSDPAITLPPPPPRSTGWAAGLAARIDAQLDDFAVDTPIPGGDSTRVLTVAELEHLQRNPELRRADQELTRELSLDEAERLHDQSAARRSDPILERRTPFPTTEVSEEDIEAAIEIAPSARRGAVGVAKKKPGEP